MQVGRQVGNHKKLLPFCELAEKYEGVYIHVKYTCIFYTNSADPEEAAHHEPPLLDLRCLHTTVNKIRRFCRKNNASGCRFIYSYFDGRLPVEHLRKSWYDTVMLTDRNRI